MWSRQEIDDLINSHKEMFDKAFVERTFLLSKTMPETRAKCGKS